MDQVINLVWLAVTAVLIVGGIKTWIVVSGRREEKARQKAYDASIREEVRRQRRQK